VTIQSAAPTVTSKPRIDVGHGVRRAPIELTLGPATVRLPHGFDPLELRSIVQILAALRRSYCLRARGCGWQPG